MPRKNRKEAKTSVENRGRPQKFTRPVSYHSFPVYDDSYKIVKSTLADENMPVSEFVLQTFEDFVKNLNNLEIQIDMEIEEKKKAIADNQLQIQALEARKELILQEEKKEEEIVISINADQLNASIELSRQLKEWGKKLMKVHFDRLEQLSGKPTHQIKAFLEEYNWQPSDEQIKNFFFS